jgi:hypothetical protein
VTRSGKQKIYTGAIFMIKTLRLSLLLSVSLMITAASVRPVSAQQPLLPNLQPLPAYEVALRPLVGGGTELIFSTLTKNVGLGPLHMVAGELTVPTEQNVYQRIHLSDGSFQDILAGEFAFHDAHGHFHIEEYAEYLLEKEGDSGTSTRIGQKTSFCLLDTNRIDRKLKNAPKQPVFTSCDDFEFGQGISVGWGDAYRSHLPGQSIDVTGLETGIYLLTMVTDPNGTIMESDDSDNRSTIRIHLDMAALTVDGLPNDGGDPGEPPGDVMITGVIPATMPSGAVRAITITGSGFAQGMNVSLINGSGPAPRISNVNFENENTITATFTTKNGGPQRVRIWDLVVGPGTARDSFTVFP